MGEAIARAIARWPAVIWVLTRILVKTWVAARILMLITGKWVAAAIAAA